MNQSSQLKSSKLKPINDLNNKDNVNIDDDEEDDYMSDKFLVDNSSKTSLLFSHKEIYEHRKHKHRLECQPKSKKTLKLMEQERRETALSKPLLDPENKGFRLLQKMISSSKIDKSSDDNQQQFKHETSKRQVEELIMERKPIQIDIRVGRKGLGHECQNESKRLKTSDDSRNQIKIEAKMEQFLRYRQEKNIEHWARKDFKRLQIICYNLDQDSGRIDEPLEPWYWPEEYLKQNEMKDEECTDSEANGDTGQTVDNDDQDEIDYSQRLQSLTEYVRQKYFYCLWCGCKYDSNDDMESNCPGNQRELH